jgi:hypothetical protein
MKHSKNTAHSFASMEEEILLFLVMLYCYSDKHFIHVKKHKNGIQGNYIVSMTIKVKSDDHDKKGNDSGQQTNYGKHVMMSSWIIIMEHVIVKIMDDDVILENRG